MLLRTEKSFYIKWIWGVSFDIYNSYLSSLYSIWLFLLFVWFCTWPTIPGDVLSDNYSNTVANKLIYGLFLYKGSRNHWKQFVLAPQSNDGIYFISYSYWFDISLEFWFGITEFYFHFNISLRQIEALFLWTGYNRSLGINRSYTSILKAKGWFQSLLSYYGLQNPIQSWPYIFL